MLKILHAITLAIKAISLANLASPNSIAAGYKTPQACHLISFIYILLHNGAKLGKIPSYYHLYATSTTATNQAMYRSGAK